MSSAPAGNFEMRGYFPGVVGAIVQLHATYYSEYWGFDISFETQVGRAWDLWALKAAATVGALAQQPV